MNKTRKKNIVIALAVGLGATLLTGCGGGSTAATTAAVAASTYSTYNSTASGYGAGCIPLTSGIAFTFQNAVLNSNTIDAGAVPSGYDLLNSAGGTYGTLALSTGAVTGSYQGASADGTVLNMNITPVSTVSNYGSTAYNYNYLSTTTAASQVPIVLQGSLALNSARITQILSSINYYATLYNGVATNLTSGSLFSTAQTSMACVSAVALSLSYGGFKVTGGTAFLYTNPTPANAPHGFTVKF